MVAGIGAFGALFAAGWAVSKVYKRKSGPLWRLTASAAGVRLAESCVP